MPRVRSQLAIQAPPELLERVRAAAAARGQTVTRLLMGWIEAGLSGDLPAPGAGPDLAARVQALEAAVAQLQARGHAPRSPERASPPIPRTADAPSPERVMPVLAELPSGAIETAELAERLGLRRGTLNARVSR
ncbi:MAG: hypothetical protein RLZZ468_972, partial [Cyanobacteriota bacterium]